MTQRVQGWRKLAGAAWRAPSDPQFYGDLELDAGALLSYIDQVRQATGEHVTVTHLVGKAVARGLAEVSEAAGCGPAHGREHDRESLDVFFIVAAPGGGNSPGSRSRPRTASPLPRSPRR